VPLAVHGGASLSVDAPTTDGNTCHDAASWQEWQDLLAQSPTDMDLHTLHALRLGLCVKVERGDLQQDEATTIFEDARQALLAQRRVQRLQDERRYEQPL
jgi:hypothetical protein